MTGFPVYRSILALDIESSTSPPRTNPVKAEMRRELYLALDNALLAAEIEASRCKPFIDRGDGVLVLIRPDDSIPKTRLLNPFIPALTQQLADHNASLSAGERTRQELRLRVVLHAGEVHHDDNGPFGESLDLAFRLLDAPRLKHILRDVATPLVAVVSGEIYWSIVRHNYDGIPEPTFQPLIRVYTAGRRCRGWVHVPPSVFSAPSGAEDAACMADSARTPHGMPGRF
jgi:hypothetical protein